MSVVLPAPEAPMRAVSTPGLKAPVMPCHTDRDLDAHAIIQLCQGLCYHSMCV